MTIVVTISVRPRTRGSLGYTERTIITRGGGAVETILREAGATPAGSSGGVQTAQVDFRGSDAANKAARLTRRLQAY